MSSIEEQISKTILSKAFKNYHDNPLSNIGLTVALIDEDDIYNWKCSLMGPNDSPYKGGFFRLFIKFQKTFPMTGPEVTFDTPIYHLNINPVKGMEPLGHCCISTVNFWTPDTSLEDLLVSIFALFYAGNPDSAYGLDIKKEYIYNRELYNKKVKYFIQKYAHSSVSSKDMIKWDFNYNNDNDNQD